MGVLVPFTASIAGLFFLPALLVADPAVAVTLESTLPSAPGRIRQFALDGDENTFFQSTNKAGRGDSFTVVFDTPVKLKTIVVTTGTPKGGDALDSGSLDVTSDGKKFEPLAKFAEGVALAKPDGKLVKAIRIQPAEDLNHPLAIRGIAIESDPPIAIFRYPVEFTVNVSNAPEMKEWADKTARICERQYAMINEELKSEGFKPPIEISMRLASDYNGVAEAGGNKIKGSVTFFKAHPDDVGAMVHETVHCVQAYRTRNNPGWLVEGIADYVRFFKYEPGKIGPIDVKRAKFDGSYRVSAAFLAFVSDKYDKELVKKLNKSMREGEYKEEIWKVLTKKTLAELGAEWKASLSK